MSDAAIVFRNALIVDGTGAPAAAGDVAVGDGRILAVGAFDGSVGEEVDASGLALADDLQTEFQLARPRVVTGTSSTARS